MRKRGSSLGLALLLAVAGLALTAGPATAQSGSYANCKGKFGTHAKNVKCGLARKQAKRAYGKIVNHYQSTQGIQRKFKMGKWKCKNRFLFMQQWTTNCKRARISGNTQVFNMHWAFPPMPIN